MVVVMVAFWSVVVVAVAVAVMGAVVVAVGVSVAVVVAVMWSSPGACPGGTKVPHPCVYVRAGGISGGGVDSDTQAFSTKASPEFRFLW